MSQERTVLEYSSPESRQIRIGNVSASVANGVILTTFVVDIVLALDRGWVPWEIYDPLRICASMSGMAMAPIALIVGLAFQMSDSRRFWLFVMGVLSLVAAVVAPSFQHG